MNKKGNVSSNVMEQRREPDDSLDDFPTQPWQVRAVIEYALKPRLPDLKTLTAWEPCCNRGHMASPMAEAFGQVFTSDVKDYGWAGHQHTGGFLFPDPPHPRVATEGCDVIMFNPPFRLASEFVLRALDLKPRFGVAMIIRVGFVDGIERYETLFSKVPPTLEVQPCERVPMVKGRYDPKASTATVYRWFVWLPGRPREPTLWMPPCRKRLERASDVKWSKREGADV